MPISPDNTWKSRIQLKQKIDKVANWFGGFQLKFNIFFLKVCPDFFFPDIWLIHF